MRGWLALPLIGIALASPAAMAATEVRGNPDLAGGMNRWVAAADARDDWAAFDALPGWPQVRPATVGVGADDQPFSVDESLLEGASRAAPQAAKRDRFIWVVPLIAFAGLTAVFGGRRSGGRGLIAAA